MIPFDSDSDVRRCIVEQKKYFEALSVYGNGGEVETQHNNFMFIL